MDKITKCVHGATSPLLANLYLNSLDHAVNETPAHDAKLIRYADDFVIVTRLGNADDLLVRLKRYLAGKKLKLNETKTRVVDSRRERFSFLGFEFARYRSTSTGRSYVHVLPTKKARQSLRDSQRATLKAVRDGLMARRHEPIPAQGAWLRQVAQGYYNYYAVPTNSRSLQVFRNELVKAWRFALRRRSQRSRVTWERMRILAQRWLPRGRVCHPWPWDRFAATTQGKSRVR